MQTQLRTTLALGLLLGSTIAHAALVGSSTSVRLSMRDCVAGATACDSITAIQHLVTGGNPGDAAAAAALTIPAYGATSGSAQLTGDGGSTLSGNATSEAGKRNSTNSASLQRFTYTGAAATTLTYFADLSFTQTVPAANAAFDPAAAAAVFSGAGGFLEVFTLTGATFDAGTTVASNFNALFGGYTLEPGYTSLGSASFPSSNLAGAGSQTLAVTFAVNPGDSVFLWALLQTPAVNGASVDARLVAGIPEPGTLALAGLSLAALGFAGRRRR